MIVFLLQILVLNSRTDRAVGAEFGAVTDSLQEYFRRLYLIEWNGDQPSALDRATTSASAQFEICQNIIGSGVFAAYAKHSVTVAEARVRLARQPPNRHLLLQPASSIIGPTSASDAHVNLYHQRLIPVDTRFPPHRIGIDRLVVKKEYTFACFLEEYPDYYDEEEDSRAASNSIIAIIYVSKVYKMHQGLWAHRFVFNEIDESVDVLLAERSADVYTRPDFNVELHYLELRKLREPASSCDLDPVCKHVYDSQVLRLCEIVLSSSYFREKLEYPLRVHMRDNGWFRAKVSFRTDEGRRAAAASKAGEYSEIMSTCLVRNKPDGKPGTVHISRAYNAHQVFVYLQEPIGKFYLENLSINVSIVHEWYRFDEVEI